MADRPYIPLFAGMEVVRRSGPLTRFPVSNLLGNVPDTPPPEPTGAVLNAVTIRQGTGNIGVYVNMPASKVGDILLCFTMSTADALHTSSGVGAWNNLGTFAAPDGQRISAAWTRRVAGSPGLEVNSVMASNTGKYNMIAMAVRPGTAGLNVGTPVFATVAGNTPPSIVTPDPAVDVGAFLVAVVMRRAAGGGNSTPWVFDAPGWTTGQVTTLNGISGYGVRDSVPADQRTFTATVTPNADAVNRVLSLVVPLVAP